MSEIKVGDVVFYKWGMDDPRDGRPSLVVAVPEGFIRLVYGTKQHTDAAYLRSSDAVIPEVKSRRFGLDCETRFDFTRVITRPADSVGEPVGNITTDSAVYADCIKASRATNRALRRRMKVDDDGVA